MSQSEKVGWGEGGDARGSREPVCSHLVDKGGQLKLRIIKLKTRAVRRRRTSQQTNGRPFASNKILLKNKFCQYSGVNHHDNFLPRMYYNNNNLWDGQQRLLKGWCLLTLYSILWEGFRVFISLRRSEQDTGYTYTLVATLWKQNNCFREC